MHLTEAHVFRGRQQVALVKVQHRVGISVVNTRVDRTDLVGDVPNGRHVVAEKLSRRLGEAEAVDRFKDGQAPAGSQDPEELLERGWFVVNVDQDRARGDDIHGLVRQDGKVIGRGTDELASVDDSHPLGQHACRIEQVLGDITEDHRPVLPHLGNCTKGDEAVPGPHVEDGVPLLDRRTPQHPIPNRIEHVEHGPLLANVTAEAAL